MKTQKKVVPILFIVLLLSINLALALTATTANARMVLYAVKGDTISKTILVQNTNNISVNLEMFASGDLEKDTKIIEPNFTLAPGEDRAVPFTIKVKKSGTTETKINMKFTSTEEKNGIGISSTVVIIAKDSASSDDSEENNSTTNSTGTSLGIGKAISNITSMNPALLLVISLGILLLLLIIVLIILLRKNKFKRAVSRVE